MCEGGGGEKRYDDGARGVVRGGQTTAALIIRERGRGEEDDGRGEGGRGGIRVCEGTYGTYDNGTCMNVINVVPLPTWMTVVEIRSSSARSHFSQANKRRARYTLAYLVIT